MTAVRTLSKTSDVGTTLHAIVEAFSPAEDVTYGEGPDTTTMRTTALWSELGTWDFNKNYTLSIWLHDHASEGWPHDSPTLKDEYYDPLDTDREWCPADILKGAIDDVAAKEAEYVEEGEDPHVATTELKALVAALDVLTANGWTVRVLWYRL